MTETTQFGLPTKWLVYLGLAIGLALLSFNYLPEKYGDPMKARIAIGLITAATLLFAWKGGIKSAYLGVFLVIVFILGIISFFYYDEITKEINDAITGLMAALGLIDEGGGGNGEEPPVNPITDAELKAKAREKLYSNYCNPNMGEIYLVGTDTINQTADNANVDRGTWPLLQDYALVVKPEIVDYFKAEPGEVPAWEQQNNWYQINTEQYYIVKLGQADFEEKSLQLAVKVTCQIIKCDSSSVFGFIETVCGQHSSLEKSLKYNQRHVQKHLLSHCPGIS